MNTEEVSTTQVEFRRKLGKLLAEVELLLCKKNAAYGDSALNPVRIFSQVSTNEQLRVRLDDKLSRLSRGKAAGEDTIIDVLGYLVLLVMSDPNLRARLESEGKEGEG